MKKTFLLVLLSICALIATPLANSEVHPLALSIEYVGSQDSPIYPILIADSNESSKVYTALLRKRSRFALIYSNVVPSLLLRQIAVESRKYDRDGNPVGDPERFTWMVRVGIYGKEGDEVFSLNEQSALDFISIAIKKSSRVQSLHKDLDEFRTRLIAMDVHSRNNKSGPPSSSASRKDDGLLPILEPVHLRRGAPGY